MIDEYIMLVNKILFINRAPFKENLEISFKEGINVLCGINGRGKTTILSYIVDALYEMAKPNYSGSFEGREHMYYRLSSSSHTIDSRKPSIVYIRFKIGDRIIDYIDACGALSETEYNDLVRYEGKIEYNKIHNGLALNNIVKLFSCDETDAAIKNAFTENVLTYFPSYRYELPGYLNNPFKGDVKIGNAIRFYGELPNPIEVCSDMTEFSSWILDVVLDWEVNKSIQTTRKGEEYINVDVTPESKVWNNLSLMMSKILISKNCGGLVRFGIGRRNKGGNRISVMYDSPSGKSEQLCPNLSLLSSGEMALMCLFGEIIRQSDTLCYNLPLDQIYGIVLIDEIEKHLHIRLQKEILPALLRLFPSIQFIVSSHSPFLNMGLASEQGIKSQIFDLDNGALECEPTTNEVYQNTYELFLGERNSYAEALSKIQPKIEALVKPLVITEGKSDWKHLKKALEYFKSKGRYCDLDIELLEYNYDFGDSKLDAALKHYSQFPNRFRVIGIFDCDEANGKRIHELGGKLEYGNNVYGMSIPIPDFRSYHSGGISIEFLYKDTDLKRTDTNGRRLYVTSEFNADGRLLADLTIGVRNDKEINRYIDSSKEKIHDHHVIDIHGKSLALSKEDFAVDILEAKQPFDTMDFSGFGPVFDRLNSIVKSEV